jgi:hypothetical protein
VSKDINYNRIINFQRSIIRGNHICVMCGKQDTTECVIPAQNKDVCKTCDSQIWYAQKYDTEFKFCKGNFFLVSLNYAKLMSVITSRMQKFCLFT